jgi:transcription initiation factor TFIIB
MVMQTSILSCNCGKGQLVTDLESGEIACNKCGLVTTERIQESRAEWRTFDSDGVDRSRVGSPSSLAYHDMGLATVIGKANRDSSGRQLNASMTSRIQRLRTWDLRTKAHSPTDRSLLHAFNELDRLKDKLGLSDAIMEKTAYVYRKAQEKQLVRGRSISSILAAAIYAACREMDASRTLGDVAIATNVKRKAISRSYRILILELDIKVPLVNPMKCIAKIANKANLSEKTKRMAMGAMNDVIGKEISAGKLPMGLAATVLYMSCLANGESITQKDIADAAGVTEVTIRNRFKDLKSRIRLGSAD